MVDKIQTLFNESKKVEIKTYHGLTAIFAEKEKANFILRGLRNGMDLDYENPISQVNRLVNQKLESIFLITKPELSYISSSIVRDLYLYNEDVSAFLPYSLK
jgi:pantetheine-phosphate adenylyltransferase